MMRLRGIEAMGIPDAPDLPAITTISTVISEDVPVVATSEINGVTPPKSGATKTTWDAADAILATGIKPTRSGRGSCRRFRRQRSATAAAASHSQWCRYTTASTAKNPGSCLLN